MMSVGRRAPAQRALAALALCCAVVVLVLAPAVALAQTAPEPVAGHAGPATQTPDEHAGEQHEEAINWFTGMIGEKDGVPPSIWWRPKGMEPPLAAEMFDAGLVIFGVVYFARRPLADALRKRRSAIMHGIQDAARMKDDAAARLAEFEEKLQHVDDDIERVKREMREAGEAERERILADAKERRVRMERDARSLIEQELKAAREILIAETVKSAVRSAEEMLAKQITPADQQRLADEFLASLEKVELNAPGGKA